MGYQISDSNDSGSDEESIPYEEQVKFSEEVRKLSNEGITKIVKKVMEMCPEALEDIDS